MTELPRLLQLVSSALPVGGFAYSRGLETAVERGWVSNVEETRDWIAGLLHRSVAVLDAPLVDRLYVAWAEGKGVDPWVELAVATRETYELQRESESMGRALTRLIRDLSLISGEEEVLAKKAYVAAFALAAQRFGLDRERALEGFLWTWLEATVAAAIKLVPLGQTEGQRLLFELSPALAEVAERARALPDDDIGAVVPGFALASMLHETQHTRLFRS
ncbi:MAG: urease accessory UreF family protein [Myxococcota bacterium]